MSNGLQNTSAVSGTTSTGAAPPLDKAVEEVTSSSADKGKGKGKGKQVELADDDDEDDDEDEDMEDDDDDDDDDLDEDLSEIDPSLIITSSRRSTRSTVDYASAEAAQKAGLNEGIIEEDEEEEAEGDKTFDQ